MAAVEIEATSLAVAGNDVVLFGRAVALVGVMYVMPDMASAVPAAAGGRRKARALAPSLAVPKSPTAGDVLGRPALFLHCAARNYIAAPTLMKYFPRSGRPQVAGLRSTRRHR